MLSTRLLTPTLILAAAAVAACNTTKKANAPQAGANAGVTITSKVDDGKEPAATTPTGKTPPASNTGGTGDTAADQAAAAQAADCYKADASICKVEAEILRLTNIERANPSGFRGKMPPLGLAPKLSWVAREWSGTQGNRGNIGHDGFPNQRERKFGGEFTGSQADISAENVAMTGSGSEADVARQFFTMWKNSPGHYANMMGNYAKMGIGVAQGRDGWYATEIFGDE